MKRVFVWLSTLLLIACGSDSGTGQNAATSEDPFIIVALGDSLTEGYGVGPEEAYPFVLGQRLEKEGWPVSVVNAGISGDTSADVLARIDQVIETHHPNLVILAIGANDGLRRMPVSDMEANIRNILTQCEAASIPVLFCGMKIHLNMGKGYASDFEAVYPALAKEKDLRFIPFFLEGVALKRSLNLSDGIHPNAEGYREIVRRILPDVEKALKKEGVRPGR
ncbi:arylesterase [Desulfosarcina sp. OttesenSCG-928-B08]|nr:arylesterase [Desulfosarcina sp. OttesenSCG-928-B08]